MRSALLLLPFLLTGAPGDDSVSACGEAALAAAPDSWDPASVVRGDLTGDGKDDVVFWKREVGGVLLFIAACEQDRPVETWRFRVALGNDCPPAANLVAITNLLLDEEMVSRVCAGGNSEECQHLRRENERRQKLSEAGGRQLRVVSPGCADTRFRWSAEQHGFLRIGG